MSVELSVRFTRGGFDLDVQASLGPGVTGIFGPNGSGKSTLLHLIAGLLPTAEGRVVAGTVVLQDTATGVFLPPEARRVGVVFQDLRLFPHLSVAGNLRYALRPGGDRFDEIVSLLGLAPHLDRRPAALSGGERQRVALARALLTSPRLLLLDEPLAALDTATKREVLPYLRRAAEAAGVPVLLVSHALAEVEPLTDRLLVLDAGRVVGCGPVSELLLDPAVLQVAQRIGLDNVLAVTDVAADEPAGLLRGRVGSLPICLPLGAPPHVLDRGEGYIALRPEDIILVRGEVGRTSARNALTGVVRDLVDVGVRVVVQIDAGVPLIISVTRSAVEELEIDRGTELTCLIKTTSLRWVG